MNNNGCILVKKELISTSPQKMNVVASVIRKKNLYNSLYFLSSKNGLLKKGGEIILKLLWGVKKKIENDKKNVSDYFIDNIFVNKSFIRKKIFYRARGRSDVVRKRYSSIKIVLSVYPRAKS